MFDDFMFQSIPVIFVVFFVIFIGVILFQVFGGITKWSKNNNSPQLTVRAKVVAKRAAVRGGGETRAYNDYFVTFEVDSGDRMELEVKDIDYGMLVEGDIGELSFQGSRYLTFSRTSMKNTNEIR